MQTFVESILSSVGSHVPHSMFAIFGPLAEKSAVGVHILLFYFYLLAAAWFTFKWVFGGGLTKTAFALSCLGVVISTAAPLVAYAVANHVLPLQWEGAWHVGALAPALMMAARYLGQSHDEEPASISMAEMAAHVSDREKLMSMLSQTSDGIMTVNRLGRIEMINASAEKLLGVRHREILGQSLAMLSERIKFYSEDQQPLRLEEWAVSRALREGTIANEQSVQLFPFKSKGLFLRVTASPLRDPDGRVDTVICVFKDRTAQRQLEILKEELFARPSQGAALQPPPAPSYGAPAAAPAMPVPAAIPAAPVQGGTASQPAAPGAAVTGPIPTAQFLKTFLWEQSGEATKMGVTFLDQIPSVLPAAHVPPAGLKRALGSLMKYALNTTASGGMVRVWASAKEDRIFVAIRDGGMGMIADEVTRFVDQIEGLSSQKGDQQRNPLYPLIIAREELAALGVRLNVRSDGLKKGTEYYFLLPATAAGSAPASPPPASAPQGAPAPRSGPAKPGDVDWVG